MTKNKTESIFINIKANMCIFVSRSYEKSVIYWK